MSGQRCVVLSLALMLFSPSADASSICRECVVRPIRARMPALRACYEKLLGRAPEARGVLAVRFVISKDGRVHEARVQNDAFGDAPFRACIETEFRALQYPATPDRITVTYPLRFVPEK